METSVQATVGSPSAVIHDADDEVAYRTISVISLVSLVFGLAAPLCLMAPLLLAVPIVGAVLAVSAIRRIAASDGTLIGRKAAVIALALCVASACAAVARTTFTEQLLSRQARQVALEWFALLQSGETEKAFGLTVASTQGTPPPPPEGSPEAAAPPPPLPIEQFRADPVVHFLVDHARGAAVGYIQDLEFDPGVRGETRILQRFGVSAAENSAAGAKTTVDLVMQRLRANHQNPARWLVSQYKSDELPSHAHDDP